MPEEQIANLSRHKIAMLIDGDNAQSSLLPQMLVGGRLQAMPYKLPLYRRAAFARMSAFGAMLLAIFAAGSLSSNTSLWLIIICYSIFNFGGGTSTLV